MKIDRVIFNEVRDEDLRVTRRLLLLVIEEQRRIERMFADDKPITASNRTKELEECRRWLEKRIEYTGIIEDLYNTGDLLA